MRSTLATIEDAPAQGFIASEILNRNMTNTSMWIGKARYCGDHRFRWIDGTHRSAFRPEVINKDQEGANCMQLEVESQEEVHWKAAKCTEKKSFICRARAFVAADRVPPTLPTTRLPWGNPCPDKSWCFFKDRCMKVFDTPRLTHEEAEESCKEQAGNLVSIHDEEQNAYVARMAQFYEPSPFVKEDDLNYYIGLSEQLPLDDAAWTDGSTLDYFNWAPGEPTDTDEFGTHESCVMMRIRTNLNESGKWDDGRCNQRRSYICSKDPVTTVGSNTTVKPPKPAVVPGNCREGWTKYDNRCYRLFENTMGTYNDSQRLCRTIHEQKSQIDYSFDANNASSSAIMPAPQRYKTNLVSIHDVYEQAFVTSMMIDLQNQQNPVYIGLRTFDGDVELSWTDESRMDFSRFAATSYDKHYKMLKFSAISKGECVAIFPDSPNVWRILPHSTCVSPSNDYYMCEHNANPLVPAPTPKGPCAKDELAYGNGTCYSFVKEPKTWNDAERYCQQKGGHLTSLKDIFDTSKIIATTHDLPEEMGFEEFWIGMNSMNFKPRNTDRAYTPAEQFVWSDKFPVQTVLWGRGEPKNTNSRQCVRMSLVEPECKDREFGSRGAVWKTDDCERRLPFVCKRTSDKAPEVKWTGKCKPGWFETPTSCYTVERDLLDWPSAEKSCATKYRDSTHLANFHSQEDWQGLVNRKADIRDGTNQFAFHIGLRQNSDNGEVKWSDGSSVDFSALALKNRRDGTDNCAVVLFVGGLADWVWSQCNQERPYICVQRKESVVTNSAAEPLTSPSSGSSSSLAGIFIGCALVIAFVLAIVFVGRRIGLHTKLRNKLAGIQMPNVPEMFRRDSIPRQRLCDPVDYSNNGPHADHGVVIRP